LKKVGIFDSGVGGLSVVKSILEENLFKEIIYYGDTARVPYGPKDKNTIIRYALEALEFFKNFEIDLLIIACNSVSAYAIEDLKEVAPFPVVGVIEPGVKALQNRLKDKNSSILITGTKATINSKKYKNLLQDLGYKNIIEKATPLFVPIVEEKIYNGEIVDVAMKHYFKDLKDIDALIMGCTHFPLLKKEYQKHFSKTLLIHSGEAIVEHLKKNFNLKKTYKQTNISYYATENPAHLKEVAKEWLSF
jgi:glutamate racemase